MKRFTLPCKFGDVEAPFHIYVGAHFDKKKHPLQNQAWWLQSERGGMIPQVVMESFENLAKISIDNNVNFEELCSWSLAQAEEEHEKLKKSEIIKLYKFLQSR